MKLTPLMKTIVSFNISDDGSHFVAVLNSGDLIIWNKDKTKLVHIKGRHEFALKLGCHYPNVFVSSDATKIILVTSRNKVFVWETEKLAEQVLTGEDKAFLFCMNQPSNVDGNWSDIVASKDIKSVEDNKELVLDAQFNISLVKFSKFFEINLI